MMRCFRWCVSQVGCRVMNLKSCQAGCSQVTKGDKAEGFAGRPGKVRNWWGYNLLYSNKQTNNNKFWDYHTDHSSRSPLPRASEPNVDLLRGRSSLYVCTTDVWLVTAGTGFLSKQTVKEECYKESLLPAFWDENAGCIALLQEVVTHQTHTASHECISTQACKQSSPWLNI